MKCLNLKILNTYGEIKRKIVLGGERINIGDGGFYMSPTIVNNIEMNSEIFQNEIFGPVLSVSIFKALLVYELYLFGMVETTSTCLTCFIFFKTLTKAVFLNEPAHKSG